ncbi:MAG: metal ABC transporter permease [Spirochaetaceae bacterium]|nr:MAG: metal ABC transporter permease [Spirochaetaceae bacterium]
MIDIIFEPLRFGFMRTSFLVAILVSIACSTIGVYVVYRRMAFIGDALAHTVLPGLVVAYLVGINMFAGALVAGLASSLAIGRITQNKSVSEDTAIGIVFAGMFALGIFLMSRTGSFRELSHMLFGNILGIPDSMLIWIALIAISIPLFLFLLHKELELTSYDPSHAEVIGLRVDTVRYILLILLALTIVTTISAVGVVLTSALIITPAAAASLLTRRLVPMMVLSTVFGATSGILGLYASYYFNAASGAAIVLVCTAIFAVCALIEWAMRDRVNLKRSAA